MKISLASHPFGQITSISGLNITIEVEDSLLTNNLEVEVVSGNTTKKYFVGTVGDIFLIGGPTTNDTIHYGIFEEVKLVNVTDSGMQTKAKAVVIAKVIGYQNPKVSQELKFSRGVGHYPRFNASCYLLTHEEKQTLFSLASGEGLTVGKVPGVIDENVSINIEKFLGKHSVVLGSTGAGKSCTVASILQKVLQQHAFSHIVFFDLHDEYSAAFPDKTTEGNKHAVYSVNKITANKFELPYWHLNFEEFQSVFLGDIDNAKNSEGIRILKEEIIKLKEESHKGIAEYVGEIERININSPLYFSFEKLVEKLKLLNKKTIWKSDGQSTWHEESKCFVANSGSSKIDRKGSSEKDQAVQDPIYYDKLHSIIEKLESARNDRRYRFLFPTGHNVSTDLYGYLSGMLSIPINKNQTQVTILDLSKIPSEITPVIIGIISRMCFEYKLWEKDPKKLPLLLIFEEAHNYIPRDITSVTSLPSKYIGRIAKEGRKYGISQLIISQRPSDLSQLIVSQCSNFIVLRVTNPNDQAFVNNVLPDHLSAVSSMIPFFQNGECLIAGELVTIPTKVLIDLPEPLPNSHDVTFSRPWQQQLIDYEVKETIHRWWEVVES